MKKFIYLAVMAMFVIVLAACSKPGSTKEENTQNTSKQEETEENTTTEIAELEPEEGAELIVWGNGDEEGEWIEYVAEEFTKEFDIPITYEDVSHTDAPGKLQTDGPAGLGGDVFMGAHDHVGNMNTAGLIYDNYFADEYKERFMEGAFNGVMGFLLCLMVK